MPITAVKVTPDRTNYCRYEPGRGVVRAAVVATGGAAETVTATLRRKTQFGNLRTLATAPLTLASGIGTVTFDLAATVDADGFNSARVSRSVEDYEVSVTDGAGHTGKAVFTVLPLSVETVRQQYLIGLPLFTIERMEPRTQPKVVTGVVVVDVSRDQKVGTATLALIVSGGPAKTLSWGSGSAVAIDLTMRATYVLTSTTGAYIVVEVDPALLPGTTCSEPLVIDLGRMTDATIIDHVLDTHIDIERALAVRMEPTRIVTRAMVDYAAATEYDEVGPAVTYYRPANQIEWLSVKLPFRSVLKLRSLTGWFNRTKSLDVDGSWFVLSEKSGFVQLVPSNSAILGWQFYGPGIYTIFINMDTVPDFWNYEIVAGLREMTADLRDLVGKRAAIPLLTMAGQARFAGITSQSTSRDGVSESRSTVPGVYSSTIDRYRMDTGLTQDGRDRGVSKMRDRYAGLSFVTIG